MWDSFQIGFWHPFGPYTGRTTAEVLDWKEDEIQRHGWTLWSFAYSPTASAWLQDLAGATTPVYALCSHSPNARDPDANRGTLRATHYRYLDEPTWRKMPDAKAMYVTNPFKRRALALAFKVHRLFRVTPTIPNFAVEWYCRADRAWRSDRLPTRGEFLIRRGGVAALRSVGAVLELAPPFLAELKCNGDDGA